MTLARPLLLLALLSLPVLWLLARRRAVRRETVVSSLLVWRRLGLAPEPPRELRRRADRLLGLRLAVAALLSLGLAGPRLVPSEGPPSVVVLVDDSASMTAFAAAAADAVARVEAAAPAGATLDVRRSPGLAGLAAALAEGPGDVVVVTDHRPEGLPEDGRFRAILVGAPVENVGIVSAWVVPGDPPAFGAVVRSFASAPREVAVAGPGGSERFELAPGESRLVSGPAPEGRAEVRIEPGDRFAFDDRVEVVLRPAAPVALAWRGPDEPRLRAALSIGGVRFEAGAAAAVAYRVDPGADARLVVAPPGPRREPSGAPVGAGGLPADAVPPPGVTFGPVAELPPGGTTLLYDGAGPLAVDRDGTIFVAPDPGDPVSTWAEDPSFPVFFAAVARRLGAVPARSEIVAGTVDPAESATAPAAASPSLAGLEPRPAAGAPPPVDFAPVLWLLAAAGLVLHLVLEGRSAGGEVSSTRWRPRPE